MINSQTNRQLFDLIYPIGSIYISATLTTVAQVQALFGGTWELFGAGRVLVGKDSSTEFGTMLKTGGEKTHTLSVSEMPSHNHTFTGTAASHSHSVLGASRAKDSYAYACGGSDAAACIGGLPKNNTNTTYTSNNGGYGSASSGGQTGQWIQHTSLTPSGTIGSKGDGSAHNNIQPYIVVSMFRRTGLGGHNRLCILLPIIKRRKMVC